MSTDIERVRFDDGFSIKEFEELSNTIAKVLYANRNVTREVIANDTKDDLYVHYWLDLFDVTPTCKEDVIDLWTDNTIYIGYFYTKEDWSIFINSKNVSYNGVELL